MAVAGPYLDANGSNSPHPKSRDVRVLWRLVALVKPHRARFAMAVVSLFGASAVSMTYPQAMRYAIDEGMRGKSSHLLDQVVLGLVVLFVINAGLVWVRHYSMSWLGERVVADVRGMVFDRLLALPLAWFAERRTGELVGRLASDVTVVENAVGTDLSMALRNLLQFIGGLTFLLIISVKLTLWMLVIVPPIVITTMLFSRRLRALSREVQDELATVSGHAQEALGAIATVQGFVREHREALRYRGGVERAFHKTLEMIRWRSWFFAIAMSAGYLGVVFVIWMGGRAMIAGELSAGDLTSFFLYTFMMAGAMSELASIWGNLQRAAGATERLFAVVDTIPEIADPPTPAQLPDGGGDVQFQAVSFAYPSRPEVTVLSDLTLQIAPGEVLAVVGPSGAGKSTLLSLLFRFVDVQAGAVTLDGVDVRQLKLAELRGALAMVAQEPVLFSGSLRDNIAYGRPTASHAEIERAARDANAHEFITGFPQGYDTVIGERGTKLSGGQKQRVAIARAILANPRVLILDEATSNLDAESEAAVQAALARLMQGRTTLIVAHRLSTVRDADRIIVMEHGRIVEMGKHEALMAQAGVYAKLVEHQLVAR